MPNIKFFEILRLGKSPRIFVLGSEIIISRQFGALVVGSRAFREDGSLEPELLFLNSVLKMSSVHIFIN